MLSSKNNKRYSEKYTKKVRMFKRGYTISDNKNEAENEK